MLCKRRPLFIVHPAIAVSCSATDNAIGDAAAAQRLANLLRQFGDVTSVDAIDDVNTIAERAASRGRQVLLVCFTQPQWLPTVTACKMVAAFSWPYETVPLESWGEHAFHDWRVALRGCAGVITFSQHAASTLSAAIGPTLPVLDVSPAPAPSGADHQAATTDDMPWHIDIHGVVLDSHSQDFSATTPVELPDMTPRTSRIALQGIVYTSVLNPIDAAKNWLDTLHGFCITFRDNAQVTLILKLCHPDTLRLCVMAQQGLQGQSLLCRIIVVVAHLDTENYSTLIRNSHFYFSAAHAHGKATAIVEYLQAGVPVIAPRHTATSALLDDSNSLAISCSREWTYWPHDGREKLSTYRYRMVWESIRQQLLCSFTIATQNPLLYQRLRAQARASVAGRDAADTAKLSGWLTSLGITAKQKKTPATACSDAPGALRRLRHTLRRLLRPRT